VNREWVQDPGRKDWHLVIRHDEVVRTWCGLEWLDDDEVAERTKPESQIDGLFDSQHDECYRQAHDPLHTLPGPDGGRDDR
jgi:hypothetical protein